MTASISKENRAALQSVRAKARKALAVSGADLPKAISAHLSAVVTYVDAQLKVTPIKSAKGKAAKSAKSTKGKRAKSTKSETVAAAA